MPDIKDYTGKITSEHADKPKYMAMVEAVSQCFLDTNHVAAGLPDDFDLDLANDAQLDDVGLWVGISRNIPTPLTNVYFALDTPGLGFDQGAWKGPFDPDNGITILDNETYRSLIRAKIGANHWDGTLESSKAILDLIFNPDGHAPFFPVTATNEPFATGDGVTSTFQLKYQGQNVYETTALDIFKSDWQGLQKLYPTPRTNMAFRSADFANAAWTKANTSIVTSSISAPDGIGVFEKLVESTTNTAHQISQSGKVLVGNTKYTRSVFAKPDGSGRLLQLASDFGSAWSDGGYARFNLDNGTIASATLPDGAYGMTLMQDGSYKCWITSTTVSAPGTVTIIAHLVNGSTATYLGDGVSGVYLWGYQFGPADAPSSYIPTLASAVTVTDYALQPYSQLTLPSPLELGSNLSWTGQGTAYAKGNYAYLVDNQDMTISIGLAGDPPSAIQWALLTGGYITPKPQSVDIKYFYSPTVSGPLFGFDISNQYIAGFDQGSWGKVYS